MCLQRFLGEVQLKFGDLLDGKRHVPDTAQFGGVGCSVSFEAIV